MSKVEDFLSNLEYVCEQNESELHNDYSGRGMYGETCYAIYFESRSNLWNIANELEDEERDAFINLMCHACYDSMGLGGVAYFPNANLERLFN